MCYDSLNSYLGAFSENPNLITIRKLQNELIQTRARERLQTSRVESLLNERNDHLAARERLEDLLNPDYEGPNGTFVSEIAEEFDLDYLLGFVVKIVLKVGDRQDLDAIKLLKIAKDHLEKRIEILEDL